MYKILPKLLSGFLIWEAFVLLPLAFFYIRSSVPLRAEDLKVIVPTVIVGVVVVGLCCFAAPKVRGAVAVLLGALCGMVVLVVGGFVLARQVGGFETSAATFTGALALAVPSGIAGGVVGWLNRRKS